MGIYEKIDVPIKAKACFDWNFYFFEPDAANSWLILAYYD
jgi:hypothetical protein